MQPVERLADKLEAPSLDDRSYRVIRLPNKLEALLVHDPETDKASASVNVKVGSFSDADDMPGMAHAVEHLLFMGTKKYPKENAYSQYLASHSGYSNAYTASTETNYFFELSVHHESSDSASPSDGESPLYGALDRFAQFFVAPLFLSETLDRELKAVDSENKKNLQSDNWRLSQLNKSLSNPKHPFHHFSTGNLDTLRDAPRKRGIEIRKEFMDFHDKHYSANRMKLVVLGKEPLDQLESWVVDLFADVRNKDLPPNRWDGIQPYSEKEVLTQVFAKPVMDSRLLDIYFPYQDEEYMFTSQPSRYLSHLIGHEGPGSILAYIKAKGWANGLSAGEMDVCPGSAFFTISIRLTADGLKDYQEVVKAVFQYISLMKETPPQKWIVDEIKGMAEVDFRFKQKSPASSFTSRLSSVMQKPLPREWLLSGDKLIREFDVDAIIKAMSYLRTDNYRLTVVSQEFPGDWDHKEKWYGTEYRTDKIPPDFEAAVRKAGESTAKDRPAELHLPHVNEFIPTRLTVEKKEVSEPSKTPKLIRNEEGIRTWWKKDDRFWVPKGNILITLRSPLAGVTPMNVVKTKLYCDLVNDALVEYSYDAEIAGLAYELDHSMIGLDVHISGYNDKMPVLLEKVLISMRDLEVKPDRFKIVKERILRGYRNNIFQEPYRQVGDFTRWLGREGGFITEQYLAELPLITPDDVASFKPQLLHQMHIEILVHGNLYKEDALRMSSLIETTLKPRALPELQWEIRRNLILPRGSDSTYMRTLGDPANVNNCIEYYLYVGYYADMDLRARLLLLGQLTDEPGFDQLRTKEQLGYIVFTGAKMAATTMGYRVIIQSERSPEYLEGRINAFLSMFAKSLEDMTQQEFEAHKKSLINKRLEKIKNLDQETSRFWGYIGSEYFNFLQVEADVAHIKSLTKQDLITFFEQYIHPTAASRAKLSVHMVAQTAPRQVAGNISPAEQKEKVLGLLTKYLTTMGVGVDEDKLASQFSNIDIAAGDQSAMISAVADYLVEDAQVPDEHAHQIIEQGQQLLSAVLPSLGIEVQPLTDGAEDLPPVPTVKDTTFITNVHEYKTSLEATAGPRPLMDLSEFEESEPKL
ncbi:Insulinase (Peptidase M16) [Xylographa vitiligo]|nr:Insulinase (Peptidase M16) [Xylographa vitiligo]